MQINSNQIPGLIWINKVRCAPWDRRCCIGTPAAPKWALNIRQDREANGENLHALRVYFQKR